MTQVRIKAYLPMYDLQGNVINMPSVPTSLDKWASFRETIITRFNEELQVKLPGKPSYQSRQKGGVVFETPPTQQYYTLAEIEEFDDKYARDLKSHLENNIEIELLDKTYTLSNLRQLKPPATPIYPQTDKLIEETKETLSDPNISNITIYRRNLPPHSEDQIETIKSIKGVKLV